MFYKVFLSPCSNSLTHPTSLHPGWRLNLFSDAPFIPNHDSITCYQVTCFSQVIFDHYATSIYCLCPNLFETCCWCQIQINCILATINYFDEVKYWLYIMYYIWAIFELSIRPKRLAEYHILFFFIASHLMELSLCLLYSLYKGAVHHLKPKCSLPSLKAVWHYNNRIFKDLTSNLLQRSNHNVVKVHLK